MVIHESVENYLETILIIKNGTGQVGLHRHRPRRHELLKAQHQQSHAAPARKRLHHHGRGRLD